MDLCNMEEEAMVLEGDFCKAESLGGGGRDNRPVPEDADDVQDLDEVDGGGGKRSKQPSPQPHTPNICETGVYIFVETGGTDGLLAQKTLEITYEVLSSYKNKGGYDMLGRTKDQIRTTEQVNGAMASCQALKLDALVIIGGVTSNTDAAQLAKTFAEAKCATKVVGVPVTLNGDLKNQFVETTVGFDTICKAHYIQELARKKFQELITHSFDLDVDASLVTRHDPKLQTRDCFN